MQLICGCPLSWALSFFDLEWNHVGPRYNVLCGRLRSGRPWGSGCKRVGWTWRRWTCCPGMQLPAPGSGPPYAPSSVLRRLLHASKLVYALALIYCQPSCRLCCVATWLLFMLLVRC